MWTKLFEKIKNHPIVIIVTMVGSFASIIGIFLVLNDNNDVINVNRNYINKSAEELVSIFDDKTTLQAEIEVEKFYIGNWIKLYYPLKDAEKRYDEIKTVFIPFSEDDKFQIIAYFDTSWGNELSNFNIGEAIAFVGEIKDITSDVVIVSKSELIEPTIEMKMYIKNFNKQKTSLIEPLEQISLQIIPSIQEKDSIKILQQIRSKNEVRPLISIESGKNISSTPTGTYFYVFIVYLRIHEGRYKYFLDNCSINRFPSHSSYFELHYLKNSDLYLIGYINNSDIPKISILNGETNKEIMIYPEFYDRFNTIALIPLSRVIELSYREIEVTEEKDIDILDMIIR